MRTIWKFELVVTDVQKVAMPQGAVILTAREQMVSEWTDKGAWQGYAPMLWALVDSHAPMVDRLIGIVGTGNPTPETEDLAVYVGTAVCDGLVWHVFDGGEVGPSAGAGSEP